MMRPNMSPSKTKQRKEERSISSLMTSTFTYVRHKTKALKLKHIFDKEHVACFFLRPGFPTHCNFLHHFFVFVCTYDFTFHDIPMNMFHAYLSIHVLLIL